MRAGWRGMAAADLAAVKALGDGIHADFPERFEVLAERHALHPAGCRVLEAAKGGTGAILGYVLSHPWGEVPPALDSLLGALPERAATYYLHDLALAPGMRGTGAARELVRGLAAEARRAGFPHLSLTAVGRSHGFWRAQGFVPVEKTSGAARQALASYGGTACAMRLVL